MNKHEAFCNIFKSSFADSNAWRRWFFDTVVTDDDIYLSCNAQGKPVSALLMQTYSFIYQENELPTAYISCVATLPEARSMGSASHLMVDALRTARIKGMSLCTLVPAGEALRYFYRRFGFASVFYCDLMRYTALHQFDKGVGELVEPSSELLGGLERRFGCGVIHSASDYQHILDDLKLDGNTYVYAAAEGDRCAIVFATADKSAVRVKALISDGEDLSECLLHRIRESEPNKMFIVYGPPVSGNRAFLHPYGMVRIVDPMPVFLALSGRHPHLKMAIRLSDGLLDCNSGIYLIDDGKCERYDSYTGHINLDVSADTLAAILFSSSDMGEIFGLPTGRPYMSLMLDS